MHSKKVTIVDYLSVTISAFEIMNLVIYSDGVGDTTENSVFSLNQVH